MDKRLSVHGAYHHEYYVVWIPQYRNRILRHGIQTFVEAQVPQNQRYHPEVEVQQWSIPVDHIDVVLAIPPKYAVSDIVGKIKATLSRQLCCG